MSRVFAQDWVTHAYTMTYCIAQEFGRNPGKDFTLFSDTPPGVWVGGRVKTGWKPATTERTAVRSRMRRAHPERGAYLSR
jgi:hypothetical protein